VKSKHHINFILTPEDNKRLANLCGQYNQNLKQIEKYLEVDVNHRGNNFKIFGDVIGVELAQNVVKELFTLTAVKENIVPEDVHLILQKHKSKIIIEGSKNDISAEVENIKIQTPKLFITPYTTNQVKYIKNILKYDINFGVGPAGTGKTYLAVACAVSVLQQQLIDRIILVRPVVEAGEHLGFLPGDISQKVDPYLRPLYDALFEMMGSAKVEKLIAEKIIEIAPLAFMRGRTLNSSFIILDESQNTTVEQMKMLLTRIGFGSKAVITGDTTQIDLAKNRQSGLIHATKILKNIKGISFSVFESYDVVRHPLVQRIIQAYEYESDRYNSQDESHSD